MNNSMAISGVNVRRKEKQHEKGKLLNKLGESASLILIAAMFATGTVVALLCHIPVKSVMSSYSYDVLVILVAMELFTNLIAETELILGNGSDDLIAIITRALLYPGVNTVMADLSFSQYWHNADIEGAEVRKVPLKDGVHDLDGMLAAIDEKTSVVWVCNPNNPTGTIVSDEVLSAFLAKVPEDVFVVLDEAYIEYVTDRAYKDTLHYYRDYSNVILLRTFSKAYGLASFRVGYGIAQADIIAKLDPVRAPFNNTILSQKVAQIALGDQDYIVSCREANEIGKKQYVAFCEKHGLNYFPSQTNFIMFEVKTSSNVVFEEMMKRGFIIRSGAALGLDGYIRVTIGTESQNAKFLQLLEEVLTEQGVFA